MFKDRLKKLRKEKSLSQRELAKTLHLSPSTIAMYETGQREPDSETLKKIADFFDVTIDYLMGRSDIRKPIEQDNKPWWEKEEPPSDIELEEFIKNSSNIKLMGNPLDEKTKDDIMMFLRAAHEFIKQKRKREEEKDKND